MHISLQSLTKRYGKVRALDNASLEIEPGQIVSVLGTNAPVKLLCFAVLAALLPPVPEKSGMTARSFSRVTGTNIFLRDNSPAVRVAFPGRDYFAVLFET